MLKQLREPDATIQRMWLDKQPSTLIATVTGLTRSAVMGRVRRLGLTGLGGSNKSGHHKGGGRRRQLTRRHKRGTRPVAAAVPEVIHSEIVYGTYGESVPWLESRLGHCRALVSYERGTHPATWRSCAAQRIGEGPYCMGHKVQFKLPVDRRR